MHPLAAAPEIGKDHEMRRRNMSTDRDIVLRMFKRGECRPDRPSDCSLVFSSLVYVLGYAKISAGYFWTR